MRRSWIVGAVLIFLTADALGAGRTWTDRSGKFKLEAELVAVRDGSVRLKREDGRVVDVPLDRLSDDDQAYVRQHSGAKEEAGEAGAEIVRAAPEQALERPTNYNFQGMPLRDAIRQLTEQHNVEFFLDGRSMEDSGVRPDRPVTARGDRQPLETALGAILGPMDLGFDVRDDVIFVGARHETLTIVVYRLRTPVSDPRRIDFRLLFKDIMGKIEPDSWAAKGAFGTICPWPYGGGAIVVSQTRAVHRQIVKNRRDVLQPVSTPRPKGAVPKPDKGDRLSPAAALRQPTVCRFSGTPLSEVLAALAKRHRVAIILDREALKEAQVSPTLPVTVDLRGIPLQSALTLMLRESSLSWSIEADGIRIAIAPKAKEGVLDRKATEGVLDREYPLDGLVPSGPEVRMVPTGRALRRDTDVLIEAVTGTVYTRTWAIVGGPGKIEFDAQKNVLKIRQSNQAHEQIARLLDTLRALPQR